MLYLLQGFSLAIGLIIAIGAQNAFVLERSLRHERVYLVVLLCIVADIIFFSLGAYGVALLETVLPGMQRSVAFVSGIFLLGYALRSGLYVRHDRSMSLDLTDEKKDMSTKSVDAFAHRQTIRKDGSSVVAKKGIVSTVLLTLAVTLLNPHFYLDTVFLFGSKASLLLGMQRIYFLLGGSLASITWFMSLALLGKHARKYFLKAITWKILDTFIAIIMAYWAYVLLSPFLNEFLTF